MVLSGVGFDIGPITAEGVIFFAALKSHLILLGV